MSHDIYANPNRYYQILINALSKAKTFDKIVNIYIIETNILS